MKILQRHCGAVILAGALVLLLAPAEAAQRSDVMQLAANKADTSSQSKTIQQIKSVPPRKRSKCYG